MLVAAIISCSRIAFRILICKSTCLAPNSLFSTSSSTDILCITLPNASRTAWEVKFSEGMRLMKCFCRFFSYKISLTPSSNPSDMCLDHVALPSVRSRTQWDLLLRDWRRAAVGSRVSAGQDSGSSSMLTLCCASAVIADIARHCSDLCESAVRRHAVCAALPQLLSDNDREAGPLHRNKDIVTVMQDDGRMDSVQASGQCGGWFL